MDDFLPISALQHYAFCPRQFALIHLEQAWEENYWTAQGHLLHERVDNGEPEQRGNVRFERGVAVISHRLHITGKLDLLEIESRPPGRFFPVEYKRGKPKVEDWDRVQVCAQILCLEEMRDICIEEGALWYWQVRKRERVVIDDALRIHTETIIAEAQRVLANGVTPKPVFDVRCQACSLINLCEPGALQKDRSAAYVNGIYSP